MPRRIGRAHRGTVLAKTKGQSLQTAVGTADTDQSLVSGQVPLELLQLILNIFRDTFSSQFNPTLPKLLQEVKRHLYNREFENAFGRRDLTEAYAIRWSPCRALAYLHIFCNLPILSRSISSSVSTFRNRSSDECQTATTEFGQIPPSLPHRASEVHQNLEGVSKQSTRIVCIGAGAGAEMIALGAFLSHGTQRILGFQREAVSPSPWKADAGYAMVEVNAIDIADWDPVLLRLYSGITTAPPLSQYASAEIKAANQPLVDSLNYKLRYIKQDVLNMKPEDLAETFTNATLVTLMFTLNELYSTSISSTTNLLLSLNLLLSPGALLLVVDSPGSYSTLKLGTASDAGDKDGRKRYPMQWLLDHTLLKDASIGDSKNPSCKTPQWEKLISRDSEWFRRPNELRYPVELEDMRYQLHLYRRL